MANDFVDTVAGPVEKSLVGHDNWIVGLTRIADDHRHPRSLHGDERQFATIDMGLSCRGRRSVTAQVTLMLAAECQHAAPQSGSDMYGHGRISIRRDGRAVHRAHRMR